MEDWSKYINWKNKPISIVKDEVIVEVKKEIYEDGKERMFLWQKELRDKKKI